LKYILHHYSLNKKHLNKTKKDVLNMEVLILVSIFVSFFVSFLVIPIWIKKSKEIGNLWEDMNKFGNPKNVAGSGGIVVLFSVALGFLFYVALKTFYFNDSSKVVEIFALLSAMLIVSFVGTIDDLFGWHSGGMSRRSRVLIVLFGAIPLMVINAGTSAVDLPLLGFVNLGILYPLIFIPLGIILSTHTFNFLAGFNGLESGQGMLLLGGIALAGILNNTTWVSVLAVYGIAAILGFYFFNRNPAKVFPGDVFTYTIGVLIGGLAILGDMEKIVIFFFIPYILEFILKVRGKAYKRSIHNFGIPQKDGSLEPRYPKSYSLTHLSIKILKKIKPSKKVYENDIVYLINFFQLVIIILTIIIFF